MASRKKTKYLVICVSTVFVLLFIALIARGFFYKKKKEESSHSNAETSTFLSMHSTSEEIHLDEPETKFPKPDVQQKPNSIKSANDLGPIFLQIATKKVVTVDPTLSREIMEEAIEANGTNEAAMNGAVKYCQAMEAVSSSEAEKSTWVALAALARVFLNHCSLRIEPGLKLQVLTLNGFPTSMWKIIDLTSIKLIEGGAKLELFYKALLTYCHASCAFLKDGFPLTTKTASLRVICKKKLRRIICVIRKFFIAENQKRYPRFLKAYKKFIVRFQKDLGSKLDAEHFLPAHGDENILGVKHNIFYNLAADLDARTKDRLADLYIYYQLISKMTSEIVDFGKVVHEPKIVEEFKPLLIASYTSSSEYAFVKRASGKCDPKCDSNGKWIQTESTCTIVISQTSKNGCINAMNDFCAKHKGESAAPKLHQLKRKNENLISKRAELEGKAVLSTAALLFN